MIHVFNRSSAPRSFVVTVETLNLNIREISLMSGLQAVHIGHAEQRSLMITLSHWFQRIIHLRDNITNRIVTSRHAQLLSGR